MANIVTHNTLVAGASDHIELLTIPSSSFVNPILQPLSESLPLVRPLAGGPYNFKRIPRDGPLRKLRYRHCRKYPYPVPVSSTLPVHRINHP